MNTLTWLVVRDFASGVTRVRLTGALTDTELVRLAPVLRRCLLEEPLALLVELDEVTVASPIGLRVFAIVQGGDASHRPVVHLCARPDSPTGRLARHSISGLVSVQDSVIDATKLVESAPRSPYRWHEYLPPHPRSPGEARRLIGGACRSWQLTTLVDEAMVIGSELVSNAVEHAGTELDVTTTRQAGAIRISVRDRAVELPRPATGPRPGPAPGRGRGLAIIEALASDWGYAGFADGKTVWAALRLPD
ncbi:MULTISPECIES: ATP-binding protein [unclassified Solwaraspora]|uniref:ATP-binding protein n=1 Tax=unclassified Solwaraspora TaxID=2627926 RepID=UPI00248AAF40|nr:MULTISPECIES: ATP-binding protein [unclassified Solwaraspora]WBB97245.1 ATP-binding protein [Solwaraspora sp. WMMA2059]WBC18854.1 ATP-binding protein [Solwaraspora sp. WMMA2080]WJK33754.1 ATP-binding protein [Solwaraspora sp. WMMA2065]